MALLQRLKFNSSASFVGYSNKLEVLCNCAIIQYILKMLLKLAENLELIWNSNM